LVRFQIPTPSLNASYQGVGPSGDACSKSALRDVDADEHGAKDTAMLCSCQAHRRMSQIADIQRLDQDCDDRDVVRDNSLAQILSAFLGLLRM
jgi:hypothetical protein